MKTLLTIVFLLATQLASAISFPAVKGWNINEAVEHYDPKTLFDKINGAGDVYLNYGFQELFFATYQQEGSPNYITAYAYRHKDDDHAFGIYSLERGNSDNFIPVGAQGYAEEHLLHAYGNGWYIKLYSHSLDAATVSAMQSIGTEFGQTLLKDAKPPLSLALFPEAGRKAGTELFIANEVLGHSFLTGAFTAAYDEGNTELFLFTKESPEALLAMIGQYATWAGSISSFASDQLFTLTDKYNGEVYILLNGCQAALCVGASKEKAEGYLKGLVKELFYHL